MNLKKPIFTRPHFLNNFRKFVVKRIGKRVVGATFLAYFDCETRLYGNWIFKVTKYVSARKKYIWKRRFPTSLCFFLLNGTEHFIVYLIFNQEKIRRRIFIYFHPGMLSSTKFTDFWALLQNPTPLSIFFWSQSQIKHTLKKNAEVEALTTPLTVLKIFTWPANNWNSQKNLKYFLDGN
jgi:hypothetical protein